MIRHHLRIGSVMLAVTLGSCGGPTAKPADTAMALEAMPMLPGIRASLDSLGQDPSMMRRAGSRLEAETRGVVDAIHSDMTRLGMHSDAAYEALADSVVRGSAALGTASGADLDRLVAQHVDQMRRLTAVYETKVAAMK